MRRPTPLPATDRGQRAGARAGAGPDAGAAADAAAPAARTAVDDRPAAMASAAASLIGFPDATTTALDGRASDAPRSEGVDEAGGADVSLRDVWRAARARRRALRAEVRRFTVRQRRRRAVWIGAIASLVLLVAGTFAAAYSPLFGVERITVVGTQALNATTVADALHGELGRPLSLVDDSAVKAALVAFPLVESYTLEARPPHELVVRIVERTPVGAIKGPAGWTVVDAAGVALSTTSTAPAGQPAITATGGVRSDSFAAIGQVMRSLPAAIRSQVTAVSATSPDAVTLTLGGTRTKVVWGSADDSATKALSLQRIMKARPPAGVGEYDVSSPTAVVVR